MLVRSNNRRPRSTRALDELTGGDTDVGMKYARQVTGVTPILRAKAATDRSSARCVPSQRHSCAVSERVLTGTDSAALNWLCAPGRTGRHHIGGEWRCRLPLAFLAWIRLSHYGRQARD